MFTGIVKEIGSVKNVKEIEEGIELEILSSDLLPEMNIDDSVAVNGVCQTVIKKTETTFIVQSIHVTLEKTNFKNLKKDSKVNLELALKYGDRVGGHLVQGHVNTIAKVDFIERKGENLDIAFKIDSKYLPFICNEGSIAINGISLTVANVLDNGLFVVSIIPHTMNATNLGEAKVGDELNIEVDVLAKYVENLIKYKK